MRTSRKPWVITLATLSGILAAVAMVSFFLDRQTPEAAAPTLITDSLTTGSGVAAPARYEQGRALFMAKGCAPRCHSHDAVGDGLRVGPDLTQLGNPSSRLPSDEVYLRAWLKDPRAIRPDTVMPDLGLSDEEIDRLLAFLLAGPPDAPSNSSTR